jgi:hypothetical protein
MSGFIFMAGIAAVGMVVVLIFDEGGFNQYDGDYHDRYEREYDEENNEKM